MGLAADLAISERRKEPEIPRQRDAHAQGHCGGAEIAGVPLHMGDEAGGNALAAVLRQCREAAEVEVAAAPRIEDGADEGVVALRYRDPVICEGGGDAIGGF